MPSEDIKEFAITTHRTDATGLSVNAPLKRIFLIDYAADVLVGKKNLNIFLIALLLSLYSVITISIFLFGTVYPVIKNLEVKASQFVTDIFPENLSIAIKDGNVTTNVTEPYYLTVDKGRLEDISEFFGAKRDNSISRIRILTIDTKGNAEDFERYQSLALLTERSLVYYSDDEIKITSLASVKDFTLTRAIILDKIHEVNKDGKIVKIISWILLASPLILLLGLFLGNLLVLLNLALIIHFFITKTYLPSAQFSFTLKAVGFFYICYHILQVSLWLIPDYILATQPYDSISIFVVSILSYLAVIRLKSRSTASPNIV